MGEGGLVLVVIPRVYLLPSGRGCLAFIVAGPVSVSVAAGRDTWKNEDPCVTQVDRLVAFFLQRGISGGKAIMPLSGHTSETLLEV